MTTQLEELEGMLREAVEEVEKRRRENEDLSTALFQLIDEQSSQEGMIAELRLQNAKLEAMLKRSGERTLEAVTIVRDMKGSMEKMHSELRSSLQDVEQQSGSTDIRNKIRTILNLTDLNEVEGIVSEYETQVIWDRNS